MIGGKSFFFIGIGGSGMMPLALILRARGETVAGSDRSLDQEGESAKFDYLRGQGIALFAQDGSGVVSKDQIVIASAAIEDSVPDMAAARQIGALRLSRAELLASLFNESAHGIGIAGTSGKSTVTGMIAWILHALGRDPTVMNGAVMKNFVSDDAPFASALVGQGDVFVCEVDESDGSIALYRPDVAVVGNISLDHKPLSELRALFGDFVARARTAVINLDNMDSAALVAGLGSVVTYGIERPSAMLRATDIVAHPFAVDFSLVTSERSLEVSLQVPGLHNVSNALAALGAAMALGIPIEDAVGAIAGFAGLRRRFDLVGEAAGVAVLDDFGHNPDKIAATLTTLHAFPGRLLLLFQPHGYGPLKVMREALIDCFATNMAADDVLVMPDPVYRGGTVNREVGSAEIVAGVAAAGRSAQHLPLREDCAAALVAMARSGDRIVVMGARDDSLPDFARGIVTALGG